MHTWTDLFPTRWIIGSLVALVVVSVATWAFLTVTEPDPPPADLVAEVQGLPPDGGGGGGGGGGGISPCLELRLADVVAQNATFSQAFRSDVFQAAAASLDDAAAQSTSETQSQAFEAMGEALRSDLITEASSSAFSLEDLVAQQVPELRADEFISVFDDC